MYLIFITIIYYVLFFIVVIFIGISRMESHFVLAARDFNIYLKS